MQVEFFMGTMVGQNGLLLGAKLGNSVVSFDYSGEAWDEAFSAADLNKARKDLHKAVIMNYIFKNITGPSPSSEQGTYIRALSDALSTSTKTDFKDVSSVSDLDNFRDIIKTWKGKT